MNKMFVNYKVDEIEKLLLEYKIDKADELYNMLISYLEHHNAFKWKEDIEKVYRNVRCEIILKINIENIKKVFDARIISNE